MRCFKLAMVIFCLVGFVYSCNTQKVALDQLAGSWMLESNTADSLLVYQRIGDNYDPFGSVLNISKDSAIIDSYTIKCPNGTQGTIKYFSEGTWSINKKDFLLTSTVPIDLASYTFKIIELDSDKFVLIRAMPKN